MPTWRCWPTASPPPIAPKAATPTPTGLAISVSDPAVPQLMWDAGFAAYRLGDWANAEAQLEKLAETRRRRTACARKALSGRRAPICSRAIRRKSSPCSTSPPKKNPASTAMIAERMLGIDTQTGFADAVLNEADFRDLMAAPAARRAVALWQIGENEYVGSELNRAFVNNNERLDPAMAALARAIGVPNVELRASEASAARGLMLTGLFPVPPYNPDGGYRIDSFAGAGLCPHRKPLPDRGHLAGRRARPDAADAAHRLAAGRQRSRHALYDPGTSLAVGQRYIEQLLTQPGRQSAGAGRRL